LAACGRVVDGRGDGALRGGIVRNLGDLGARSDWSLGRGCLSQSLGRGVLCKALRLPRLDASRARQGRKQNLQPRLKGPKHG
jgi:hypothetical protein